MSGVFRRSLLIVTLAIALSATCLLAQDAESIIAPGAELVQVAGGFQFTEGPAADVQGNIFFTDVSASRIHKWSTDGKVSVFVENTNGTNGLYFDRKGNLLACEGGGGRIASIDPEGNVSCVVDKYDGKPFNRPNDIWIAPNGSVYFTDPVYGRSDRPQGGEHVYYISPDRTRVTRVIDDMVRPNGLIGTPDGKTLYVTDHGGKKTYRYTIGADGALTGKTLFVEVGGDGMTLDSEGNLYIAEAAILVFDKSGKQIGRIEIPERPTNVTFGGADRKMLFVTARGSVHSLQMAVTGLPAFSPEK